MTRELIADAFAHHAWANVRVCDAVLALTPVQRATTVPGTYGSIEATLRHVVGSDAGYLFTLTDGLVPDMNEDIVTLEELRDAALAYGAAWAQLLSGGLDPDVVMVRRRDDGSETHAPIGIRLAQAIHHGTDHRSQICTALTTLGATPPEIDVWAFSWERGTLIEVPPGG